MKNLISKLLPLISKFKGKKPVVIILSVIAIAAVIFATQKGYIAEDAVKLDVVIDYINNTFTDSIAIPVDTLSIEIVDSVITQ